MVKNQNIDIAISNYAMFQDSTEFIGIGPVELPSITNLTADIEGAGIAGKLTETIMGYLDPMTLKIDYRLFSGNALSLLEPKDHQIELRVAQQERDPVSQEYLQRGLKHVMIVFPKTTDPGKVATASTGDATGEYNLRYWKMILDDEVVFEFDPYNFIYIVNGTDYLAKTREVLGK